MAAVAEIPISPISAHAYHSVNDAASKFDMSHLSGATMTDLIREPDIRVIEPSPSVSSKRSSSHYPNSKRSSVASTTKSTLRQSNQILMEMLQNIQSELTTHRTIMLDIQHRVSHLECESNASVNNDAPLAALKALEGHGTHSKRGSKLLPPESKDWWQACQNFARNSDPPMSAGEFLRTPQRFSGFDWQFNAPAAKPDTPPDSPPNVEDIPALTPTSDHENTDVDTPRGTIDFKSEEMETSTPRIDEIEEPDDIRESMVEVNKRKMPAPPVLQPAPSGKPVSISSQDVAPIQDPQDKFRLYKGVKSRMTYKARMKNSKTEKEHVVLIHFHKRRDLQGLEQE
ncbi:hypothetical protein BS50DRAFT_49315 [Corynespora cassiicola Philippines]|uniref:Uncharacterized protein n=1 Tax=Corynespora cassiicola Philippines TaxID=1448308 RepID=A0A2T2NIZ0_CORCC|nr:hypothetical protein BS50DRAFT_49315 [Corynespora cassiicola Philippines]